MEGFADYSRWFYFSYFLLWSNHPGKQFRGSTAQIISLLERSFSRCTTLEMLWNVEKWKWPIMVLGVPSVTICCFSTVSISTDRALLTNCRALPVFMITAFAPKIEKVKCLMRGKMKKAHLTQNSFHLLQSLLRWGPPQSRQSLGGGPGGGEMMGVGGAELNDPIVGAPNGVDGSPKPESF